MSKKIINIAKIIGKGYGAYWRSKRRYVCVKGSRGSKKSKTTALWIIYNMMKYPLANTLVVRRVFNTLRDSCYSDLIWATYQLGVEELWQFNKSPLEAIYLPTGQRILFRGMDNPMSITSITVNKGVLCWCWIEEAFQLESEEAFNKLDMSIRGELPEKYFFRIMITFNPWSDKHWLKRRFFDNPNDMTDVFTTTYLCNEWIGQDFINIMEEMKVNNPRRYSIEGLGDWGIADGMVYENWSIEEFNYQDILQDNNVKSSIGLDFGYKADPTAMICILVNKETKDIWIYDEHYQKGMTNDDIVSMIKYKGYSKERIIADSAEQKSIDDIRSNGIRRIEPAKKGKDSIINGITRIQDYHVHVHPKCENTIIELNNYVWDKKDDIIINKPIDAYNHLMDAFRYAMEVFYNTDNKKVITRKIQGLRR